MDGSALQEERSRKAVEQERRSLAAQLQSERESRLRLEEQVRSSKADRIVRPRMHRPHPGGRCSVVSTAATGHQRIATQTLCCLQLVLMESKLARTALFAPTAPAACGGSGSVETNARMCSSAAQSGHVDRSSSSAVGSAAESPSNAGASASTLGDEPGRECTGCSSLCTISHWL